LKLTHWYGRIVDQYNAELDAAGWSGTPIWCNEFYIWKNDDPYQPSAEYQAAGMASIVFHLLTHGAATALHWEPEQQPNKPNRHNLWTSVDQVGGGQVYAPLYNALRDLTTYFPPGTPLYTVTTGDDDVEAVAND